MLKSKLNLSTKVFRTVLVVVICISFSKLLLCLWYNGPRNSSDASEQEVHQWLDSLGLGHHKELFRAHGEYNGLRINLIFLHLCFGLVTGHN